MQPHEERVVLEKRELDEKLDRLNTFTGGALFKSLPYEDRDLLLAQAVRMIQYSEILAKRIARFPTSPVPTGA